MSSRRRREEGWGGEVGEWVVGRLLVASEETTPTHRLLTYSYTPTHRHSRLISHLFLYECVCK